MTAQGIPNPLRLRHLARWQRPGLCGGCLTETCSYQHKDATRTVYLDRNIVKVGQVLKLVVAMVAISFAVLATGCAGLLPAHEVVLMAADGSGGGGQASRGTSNGTIELAINGDVYRGTWVAGRAGTMGYASSGTVFVSGTSASTTSGGTALLRSDTGGTLRCQFTYDGLGHAGFGECVDKGGKHYDLQIT